MIRNIKAMGLALLAAFAFSAIAAQASSAEVVNHEFATTGEETTIITGHQESGVNHHTFKVGNTLLTCHKATFTGTVEGKEADFVEVVPDYSECHSNVTTGTGSVTVHSNGCTYKFFSNTAETGEGEGIETHAAVGLTCPTGKTITITASGCTIHVPPFAERHGVTYTNLEKHGPLEKDALTVTATVKEIPATSTGGFTCLAAGLGFEHKTHLSTYTGNTEVTGYKDLSTTKEGEEHKFTEGEQTNIRIITP